MSDVRLHIQGIGQALVDEGALESSTGRRALEREALGGGGGQRGSDEGEGEGRLGDGSLLSTRGIGPGSRAVGRRLGVAAGRAARAVAVGDVHGRRSRGREEGQRGGW